MFSISFRMWNSDVLVPDHGLFICFAKIVVLTYPIEDY